MVRCPACRTVNAVWAETQLPAKLEVPDGPLHERCSQWNVNQVLVFAHELSKDPSISQLFQQHVIDGPQLQDLTEKDLAQMGFRSEEHIALGMTIVDVFKKP